MENIFCCLKHFLLFKLKTVILCDYLSFSFSEHILVLCRFYLCQQYFWKQSVVVMHALHGRYVAPNWLASPGHSELWMFLALRRLDLIMKRPREWGGSGEESGFGKRDTNDQSLKAISTMSPLRPPFQSHCHGPNQSLLLHLFSYIIFSS